MPECRKTTNESQPDNEGELQETIPGGSGFVRRFIDFLRGDRDRPYWVATRPAVTLAMIISLLGCTIIDGILTLELVEMGSDESNPVMRFFLGIGPGSFLIAKYVLTASGIPVLMIFKNHRLFRSCVCVGYLIPVFLGLYLVLIVYQIDMLGKLMANHP
jgi:hypothetical protein